MAISRGTDTICSMCKYGRQLVAKRSSIEHEESWRDDSTIQINLCANPDVRIAIGGPMPELTRCSFFQMAVAEPTRKLEFPCAEGAPGNITIECPGCKGKVLISRYARSMVNAGIRRLHCTKCRTDLVYLIVEEGPVKQ